jgi:homoserine kinase
MATGLLVSRIQSMPIYGVSIALLSHWQDLGRAATRESRATTDACDNEVLHHRRLPARAVRCQGTHRRVRWSNVVRYSDIERLRSGRTIVDLQNLSIVVPGSISNLGPGFDTLAVAVELFLRIRVLEVRSEAPDTLETVFPAGPPSGGNRIEVAWKLAREKFGKPAPGLRIEVTSDIPVTAGLGSSAAAAVAGLQLYAAVTEARTVGDLLSMASELEGHPDNAAAALLGGMTVSCLRDDGRVVARSWLPPRGLRFVVATPVVTLETSRSRRALPEQVPLADAVFNLQRAVLLIKSLDSGEFGDLREALRDRLHQPARAPLVPALSEALAIDHPAVLGVCLSGAGSSVVAFATAERAAEAAAVLSEVYRGLGLQHTIRTLRAHEPAAATTLHQAI